MRGLDFKPAPLLRKERDSLAEREGFEPPVQLPVRRISSAVRSSTPASFLIGRCKGTSKRAKKKIFFCFSEQDHEKTIGISLSESC